MNRIRALAVTVALAVTLGGCGTLGPSAAPPDPVASGIAAYLNGTQPTASPAITPYCDLVWLAGYDHDTGILSMQFYAGGGPYPDTAAGFAAATATGATVESGFKAGFANGGAQGARLTGYTIEVDDQGATVTSQQVDVAPVFLAPGDVQTYYVAFADLPGSTTASVQDYQRATCAITAIWDQP